MYIADTLFHLQKAGHPQYVEWSRSFACNTVTQNDLRDLNQQMKRDLQTWLAKVSSFRMKLYALNYFTCLQLLRISNEFYHLINNPNYEINNEILLLLMGLSPDLTVEKIKEVTSTDEAQSIAFKSLPSFTPPDHNESNYDIDEIDIPGEVQKLTEREQEIYSSCTEEYEYNPRMVLAAIRQFGSSENKILEWCFDPRNAEMYETDAIVNEDSIELSVSEIDISNTTVQELVDLEFSEDLAIEAVKTCGEDVTKCYDYCNKQTLAIFSDDTQDDIPDNILLDMDDSSKTEMRDTSLSEYDIYIIMCTCHNYFQKL